MNRIQFANINRLDEHVEIPVMILRSLWTSCDSKGVRHSCKLIKVECNGHYSSTRETELVDELYSDHFDTSLPDNDKNILFFGLTQCELSTNDKLCCE